MTIDSELSNLNEAVTMAVNEITGYKAAKAEIERQIRDKKLPFWTIQGMQHALDIINHYTDKD